MSEIKPGVKAKDEDGWYIIDEDLNKVYLNKERDKYIELAKKFQYNIQMSERMSMEAKHILWLNGDYGNFNS